MSPEEMVSAAVGVAEEGMAAGELPIGAVVVMGGEVIGRAFTQEVAQRRRLVHADLLALIQADEVLSGKPQRYGLRLAVNLEPCLMCLGAAMSLGVREIYFGLESPGDGASRIAADWAPDSTDLPGYTAPEMTGGIRRGEVRDQFRRYREAADDSGLRRWARTLAELPD